MSALSRLTASFTVAAAIAGFALLLPSDAFAQSKAKTAASGKEPPSCAAITFRPLPASGGNDGQDEAGLYKSRFGRVVVTGEVKGGSPVNYFVTVNGNRLAAAPNLPASVASCASAKKLPAPGKGTDACTGDKLQVLIDHTGDKRYLVLYAHAAGKWQMCNAGAA